VSKLEDGFPKAIVGEQGSGTLRKLLVDKQEDGTLKQLSVNKGTGP